MTKQSKALRLAESISRMDTFTGHQRSEILQAAAELCRLDEANAELVKTLNWLDNWLGEKPMPACVKRIRAAIAKHGGGA